MDLAIVMALISSYKDRPVNPKLLIFGEVGLSGEVRAVAQASSGSMRRLRWGLRLHPA